MTQGRQPESNLIQIYFKGTSGVFKGPHSFPLRNKTVEVWGGWNMGWGIIVDDEGKGVLRGGEGQGGGKGQGGCDCGKKRDIALATVAA